MTGRRDDPIAHAASPGFGQTDAEAPSLGPPLSAILAMATPAPAAPGAPPRQVGLVVGTLAGLDDDGRPLVQYPGNPAGGPIAARSLVPAGRGAIGREAALMFDGGDPLRPVLIGLVQPTSAEKDERREPIQIEADGDRLTLSADREIVLRCGEASITLTRAGKILLRGAYLLSRSSGVNRIKGGSVQIN